MGRSKYSREARNAIMAAFVTATKQIIEEEGIDAASIRRVSNATGYSSATLYLYFEDMNELVTMSLISYLCDYVKDIIDSTTESESAEEAYRRSWELFCMHSFAHPSIFFNLFYGPQSNNIDSISKKYYELFPSELERASGKMLEMLEHGSLRDRNKVVLEAIATELGFDERETELVNDLTVAYFQSFLQRAAVEGFSDEEIQPQIDRFMEGALFVLHGKR